MRHTIRIDFRSENGERLAGELVNPYRVVESSRFGAVAIDQIDEDFIDVLVFHGDDMQAHRVDVRRIICADEVAV